MPQSLLPSSDVVSPNDVWCIDFKGYFTVGNGERCDPLTNFDSYSRYHLTCEILFNMNLEQTKAVFERVFKDYEVPLAIKSDNGTPFASKVISGLASASV